MVSRRQAMSATVAANFAVGLLLCAASLASNALAQSDELHSVLVSNPAAPFPAEEAEIEFSSYEQACEPSFGHSPPQPIWAPLFYWKDRLVRHADPNDPLRHMGLGIPLEGTSWRNRPLYAGWFVGGIWGDPLTAAVDQSEELFGGYRLGYDFDHYWGTELRMAWANVDLIGVPATQSQTAGHSYYDINLLYYPWGDARWRPYAGIGLGLANFRFDDQAGDHHDEVLLQIPLQIGVKYLYRKWLALRFDFTDNLALGAEDLETMHNLTLSTGVEVHFGGRPRSYFPWSTSTALWW